MKKLVNILFVAALLIASVQSAQAGSLMAQSITVPLTEYTPGTYEVELNTLPGNSEGARISFSRSEVGGLTGILARIDVYQSLDNGVTWLHVQGGSFGGGVILRNGVPLTHSTFLFTWAGEASPNGRVMLKGSDVKVIAQVFQTFSTVVSIESITSTGR